MQPGGRGQAKCGGGHLWDVGPGAALPFSTAARLYFPKSQNPKYNWSCLHAPTWNISCLAGPYCPGVDVDLLMEPTRDFPGIIAPKVILILIQRQRHKDNDNDLMGLTNDFPGIIVPKVNLRFCKHCSWFLPLVQIEAATRSNIDETRHPDSDQVHDSAKVCNRVNQKHLFKNK